LTTDTYHAGAPYWAELSSSDPTAVRLFYGELFGWQFAEIELPDRDGALLCTLAGTPVALIDRAEDGLPSAWTTYIYAEEIEPVLARVVATGGKVVRAPRPSAGGRRIAAFSDPAGVVLGVFELDSQPGVASQGSALDGGELITDDVDASAAFYQAVFGWELTAPEGPMNRREWMLDGRRVGGLLPRPPAMPREIPVYWDTWFGSPHPDDVAGRAPALGGAVRMGPVELENGRLAVLSDPADAVFSIFAANPNS
jgi:hypothetical protein